MDQDARRFDAEALRAQIAAETFHDPAGFVRRAYRWGEGPLKVERGPLPWQETLLADIGAASARAAEAAARGEPAPPLRFAIASGHGVGKTAVIAWLVQWFIAVRERPQIVVTANTRNQLVHKTWRELAKWHRSFRLAPLYKWTASRYMLRAEEDVWFAAATPWSRNQPEAFAGTHEEHVLVAYDEAAGVGEPIWETTEGAMTGPGALWVAFGNPTRRSGGFHRIFTKSAAQWNLRHIDARASGRADPAQIARWLSEHEEDSDFFRVRVRGEFPKADMDALISHALVAAARGAPPIEDYGSPLIFGVDVARFGGDYCCVVARRGRTVELVTRWRDADLMRSAGTIAELMQAHRPSIAFVDADGLGGGVADRLRQLGYKAVDAHGGQVANEPDRFANRRIEMWSAVRDWLGAGASLPDDEMLAQDLTAPRAFHNGPGKLQLERKEDMRARGVRSPDAGDALAYTFWLPVAANDNEERPRPSQARSAYDPFRQRLPSAVYRR